MSKGYVATRIRSIAPDGSNRSFSSWVDDFCRKAPKQLVYPSAADALNRTAAKTKTRGVRRVAAESKVPAKIVRGRTKVYRAKARRGRLGVTISIYHRGVAATSLKARQTKRGVRAGKHFFEGAFLNVIPSNQKLHAMKRRGAERLPVDVMRIEFKGVSEFGRVFNRYARTYLPRRFAQQMDYRSKKFARRGLGK